MRGVAGKKKCNPAKLKMEVKIHIMGMSEFNHLM